MKYLYCRDFWRLGVDLLGGYPPLEKLLVVERPSTRELVIDWGTRRLMLTWWPKGAGPREKGA